MLVRRPPPRQRRRPRGPKRVRRWDMNGDGRLVASELTDARSRTGHEPAEIIRFFDTDGDGAITLREAQGGLDRTDEAERQARQ